MKPLVLSVVLVVAGLLQTQAQSQTQLLDSIVGFNMTSSGDSVLNDKLDYRYDQENREIYKGYSRWKSKEKTWDCQEYTQSTFDKRNGLIEKIEHGVLGLQFPFVREQWEYDLFGKPVTEYRYWKMYEKDGWILNGKQDIKTNESGQLIQKIEYLWEKTQNDWIADDFYSYYYDQNGHDTLQVVLYFNRQTQKWQDGQKTKTTYNEMGLKTSEKSLWLNPDGIWETVSWYWCEYDSLGRKIRDRGPVEGATWYTEYSYDSTGTCFSLNYGRIFPDTVMRLRGRTERKFDKDGRMTDYVNYSWHNDEWIPDQKTNWKYNDSGVLLEQTEWQRVQDSNEWILYWQIRYIFNELDNCRMSESYLWNPVLISWILDGRAHYYYKSTNTSITKTLTEYLLLYPNPTDGVVHLSGITAGTTLRMYNSTGILMKQEKITNEMVDLSDWPAGIYFLIISGINSTLLRCPVMKN